MVPVFLVKQVDLVVQDLHTHQHRSLVLLAATESLHLASLCVFLVNVLVIITISCIYFIEEERQKNQVMVEILKQILVDLGEVRGFLVQVILHS